MFIITEVKTLVQNVCDLLFCSSVIFKSIIASDDDFRSSQAILTCLSKQCPACRVKMVWLLGTYFPDASIFWKIFDGEMYIMNKVKTLVEIVCDLLVYFIVLFKSIFAPDENFRMYSHTGFSQQKQCPHCTGGLTLAQISRGKWRESKMLG